VSADLKTVYRASTAEKGEQRLEKFPTVSLATQLLFLQEQPTFPSGVRRWRTGNPRAA
jgi:hypothetical protein